MQSIQGIVTIVQEARFQLVAADGVAHHFLLSHRAALEPQQLPGLQRDQALVRVWYRDAPGVIGHVAARIDLIAATAPTLSSRPEQARSPASARVPNPL